MIQKFIDAWYANKYQLQLWLENDVDIENITYQHIVHALFERVINPYIENTEVPYNTNRLTVIDDGDYSGTQIYLIPKDVYEPDPWDYVVGRCFYGSCSGCDTLMYCQYLNDIDGIMTIALHIAESMKLLWEYE